LFGAVFGVVVLLLLERMVLSRLGRLSKVFGAISSSSDHAMRLPVSGHDELSQLANAANRMLESLEQSHIRLSDNEERYRTLTENTYDLIGEISREGQYLYVSPNYRDVLGYEPQELLNKSIGDTVHPEDQNALLDRLKKLEFSTFKHIVYRMICKNGEIRCFESTGRSYLTTAGEIRMVFVSRDITERQKYQETIWHQAFHDTLTGLSNRMLFKDRLSHALAHAKRNKQMLAVIFLDLDRFKLINDTLGHEIGDQLLKSVALRLKKCMREDDTIARLGGDEFTLLMPEIDKSESAAKVAQKIIEEILQPFHIGDHELYISTSIGIALYPSDGEDADTLLKNADTAMYLAKERGRNNYQFYTPALNKKTIERMTMENELRRAIERKEFVLHYQPKVNIKTHKIIGMEALVRWQHPVRGLIPPADFIPIAEETGMIVPLGEWVLHTACAQNKAWQDAGFEPLSISVNLSGCQFQLQNLAVVIKRILKETDLAPFWLELEITESTAMQNADYTIETLHKLKEMGVQFSIDDFGTGYSSLSQLKRFPVDKLKIDKSFVVEIGTGQDSEIIASTVIVLGKSLNLGVIAEGVETVEQLDFLKKHQCNEMQGFLFSKPVTADEFSALLEQNKLGRASCS
jgi:diguanylate cyclase (GGDEF)-like protein/PAS domain S-box-containing protein